MRRYVRHIGAFALVATLVVSAGDPYTWLTVSKPIYRRYLTPVFVVGAVGFSF